MYELQRTHEVVEVVLDDETTSVDLPIDGAAVVPTHASTGTFQGAAVEIVKISPGTGVTDYVTHEADFEYSTFGIHIGQDDRLTFLGVDQLVVVSLIDCREHSATVGLEVRVSMRVDPRRMIVIPRGVAHTLDGLDGVVTRDEPVWYSGDSPDWHLDNDLVSFTRTGATHPVVQTCEQPMPHEACLLVSRMSQRVNTTTHAAYAARYQVRFTDGARYVMVRPQWARAEGEGAVDDSFVDENRYALTGPESFTIVPSTDSCTSDFLRLRMDGLDETWTMHPRSHRKITWLGGEGDFAVELWTAEGPVVVQAADPTVHVNIPPATWYRYRGTGTALLRSEQQRLVPDGDLLAGPDIETTAEPAAPHPDLAEPADGWAFMPGSVANLLARKETELVTH